MDLAARLQPGLARALRLIGQRLIAVARQQRDRIARRLRQPCRDIAVAAVIAMPAENQPAARLRPLRARQLERRLPGALHQLIKRNAQRVGAVALQLVQSLRRPDGIW